MRKKVFGRKFARNTNSRKALFRGLIRALFENGSITTTKPKAKAIIPDVDHMVTIAKKGTIASKRQLLGMTGNDELTVKRLFARLESMSKRQSGYTKMMALPPRTGDKAEMVKLEFVDKFVEKKEEVKEEKTKTKAKATKVKKVSDKPQVKK
jgi:large subunit ribosomal protein L17